MALSLVPTYPYYGIISTQNITVGDQLGTPNKLLQVRPLTRASTSPSLHSSAPQLASSPQLNADVNKWPGSRASAKPPIAALKAKLLANAANFYYLASKLAINHSATELGCSMLGTRGCSTLMFHPYSSLEYPLVVLYHIF